VTFDDHFDARGAAGASDPRARAVAAGVRQQQRATGETAASAPHALNVRARLTVGAQRLDVLSGRRAFVHGVLVPGDGRRRTVVLQALRGHGWHDLARSRTAAAGRYALTASTGTLGVWALRVVVPGDGDNAAAVRPLRALQVFHRTEVSTYGGDDGLDGSALACGGVLGADTLGVANLTLPCGTRVTLRYGGRELRVPVIDRGPYVSGREFDLTSATAARLHFSGVGTVLATS
jgi:hypothetical protein